MAKYYRHLLIEKLTARREAVLDDAAYRTAVNEAGFVDWQKSKVTAFDRQIAEIHRKQSDVMKLVFGSPTPGYYDAPSPVSPDESALRAIDRALDELDILVGDEVTLKSTAMLKLL